MAAPCTGTWAIARFLWSLRSGQACLNRSSVYCATAAISSAFNFLALGILPSLTLGFSLNVLPRRSHVNWNLLFLEDQGQAVGD